MYSGATLPLGCKIEAKKPRTTDTILALFLAPPFSSSTFAPVAERKETTLVGRPCMLQVSVFGDRLRLRDRLLALSDDDLVRFLTAMTIDLEKVATSPSTIFSLFCFLLLQCGE